MKADRMGAYTEQVRARMGWKSPSERKAVELARASTRCDHCRFFYLKEIPHRDGGCCNSSPYCGHPMAGGKAGYATRVSARCDCWERRP